MPLFNVTHPSYKPTIARQLVADAPPEAHPAPARPKVRRDFGQGQNASAIVSDAPVTSTQYVMVGYYSTVRAALVVNALEQGAYAPGGLPRYLASRLPTAEDPSPTTDAAAAAYAGLVVMSYLPRQLAPSEAQFASLNDATKREASMTDLSENLNRGSSALSQTLDNVHPSNVPLIPFVPTAPPWGNALCNQSQFGVTVKANGVAMNPGTGTRVLAPTNVPGFVSQ
jgi:hypothetical protein